LNGECACKGEEAKARLSRGVWEWLELGTVVGKGFTNGNAMTGLHNVL
jgi:hypothetical protein